jgi:hypothetical protein
MILGQQAFDPEEKLFANINGRIISIDDMNTFNDARHTNEQVFALQGKLQKLELNEEERCILAAMCVMSSGLLSKSTHVVQTLKTFGRSLCGATVCVRA